MRRIQKVTDPKKRVTDSVVVKELQRQKIDIDYVEFFDDYESHPYTKRYRDLKSNKQIAVISGLPKRRKDGVKIEAGWDEADGKYHAKANLFTAVVDTGQITLTVVNDQPDGRKAGDCMSWNPQLFIGGKEIKSKDRQLLLTDPVNENYLENTIEWDYGICKRRLRIIEGRIREKWIFSERPEGEIRIKHNQTRDFRLRLGSGIDGNLNPLPIQIIDNDEEVLSDFTSIEFPIEIGANSTFYPDANPETSSVDGYVGVTEANAEFSTLKTYDGNYSRDDGTYLRIKIVATQYTNKFAELHRMIILFDTSGLDDAASISAATLSLYAGGWVDDLGCHPDINIYSSNPDTNTALIDSDFNDLGTIPFCDTPITYADWASYGYKDFILNADGINAISKTGVSKFGARNASYDVGGSIPQWASLKESQLIARSREYGAGPNYYPKLVVTYTIPQDITEEASALTEVEAVASSGIILPSSALAEIETSLSSAIISPNVASVEVEAAITGTKLRIEAVSALIEMGVVIPAKLDAVSPALVLIETKAIVPSALKFPLSIPLAMRATMPVFVAHSAPTLIEVETNITTKLDALSAISALIEMEADITGSIDLIRAISALTEMKASVSAGVIFPLSVPIEVEITIPGLAEYVRNYGGNITPSAALNILVTPSSYSGGLTFAGTVIPVPIWMQLLNGELTLTGGLSAHNPLWLLIDETLRWMGEWSAAYTYDLDDVVLHKSTDANEWHVFVSKASHNTGNIPTSSAAWWRRLLQEPLS